MFSVIFDGFYGYSLFISIQKGYYHQLKNKKFQSQPQITDQEESVNIDLNEVKNLKGYSIYRSLRTSNFRALDTEDALFEDVQEHFETTGFVIFKNQNTKRKLGESSTALLKGFIGKR